MFGSHVKCGVGARSALQLCCMRDTAGSGPQRQQRKLYAECCRAPSLPLCHVKLCYQAIRRLALLMSHARQGHGAQPLQRQHSKPLPASRQLFSKSAIGKSPTQLIELLKLFPDAMQGLAYSVSGGWSTTPADHVGLFTAGGETAKPAEFLVALQKVLQVRLALRQSRHAELAHGLALYHVWYASDAASLHVSCW